MRSLAIALLIGCSAPADPASTDPCTQVPPLPGYSIFVDMTRLPPNLGPSRTLITIEAAAEAYQAHAHAGDAGDDDVLLGWFDREEMSFPESLAETVIDHPALIRLNRSFLWTLNPNNCSGYDLQTAVEHELGHVAGLEHSSTGIMSATLRACERHCAVSY